MKLDQIQNVSVDAKTKRATFVLPAGASVSEADCARALQGMPYRVAGLEKAQP